MAELKLEAPWYTWYKKVKALFDGDPFIRIGEMYEADDEDEIDFAFAITVRNHAKFVALDRVFPRLKKFGRVAVGVFLYDEENTNNEGDGIDLYRTIFAANPHVKDIKEVTDPAGVKHGFVRFYPEVIQFFTDDLSDYDGNWNGLAEEIAQEIFEGDFRGVSFCTAAKEKR